MNRRGSGRPLPMILQVLEMVRPGSLHELMPEVYPPPVPEITLKMMEEQIHIVMRNDPDPMRSSRTAGSMYGQVFKRKEAAMNPWTPETTS